MLTVKPEPQPSGDDAARVMITARRRRILSGDWKEDARSYTAKHYAREGLDYLPPVSIERNPLQNITGQLATLYDVAPTVTTTPPTVSAAPLVTPRLLALWPQILFMVIGLNECAVRVDRLPDGRIAYRMVTPDVLREVIPDDNEPDRPVALRELRLLRRPGRVGWAYEVFDVRDPDAPVFKVIEVNGDTEADATALYYPTLAPGDYPWRALPVDGAEFGAPILPYVLYHLRVNGHLFNPLYGEEMVEGTLGIAMKATCANQGQRDLAFPQRYTLNARLAGARADKDTGGRVTVSPLAILELEGTNGQPGDVGEWASSFDAVKACTALDMQEAALSSFAGLTPADMNVGAASSGAARVISKEGLRRARLSRELSQRMGDQELLSKAAALFNATQGERVYPESPDDWQIVYNELAPLA